MTGPQSPPKQFFHLMRSLSPEETSRMRGISVFGKRLSRKTDNVVVFPFAFHIAVQQPFKSLWSRLLLYELEPSRASFALCFRSLLPALVFRFWCLSSSDAYPFDLSSKGGPASSYATAGIALRVLGILKPPHHDEVETPTRGDLVTLNKWRRIASFNCLSYQLSMVGSAPTMVVTGNG
ncbi:hypothetical protein B7P43_G06318 [Cryptotermes secundus]|uniref:Uncharacterized protein n=1 Tax=Cryptotermes secundus TaxID=105785 RepID=A0A2J7Q7C5_9NEOP|nr:hypothetical protein B7P43_G06318 [Cryptotermes secundus]